ncbi:amidohydrolase family protein [Mycoplasmopsis ciconiae]|uniref:Amidohydrolase family protein n=1 Tax=Mycoplasmopsis ciconiae TaxID=561067 RepID=A0ABU7MLN9_9BACT|nr:amidohydrolase family protein [Mycoplasmopsis ciconiae]
MQIEKNNTCVIRSVEIYNANNFIKNADIYIENGVIKKIVEVEGVSKKRAVPGFIDTHIHGFFNFDVSEGVKAIEIIAKKLSFFGTTSFIPTIMTDDFEKMKKSLEEIYEAKMCNFLGAKILGSHTEGPFIGKAKRGAHDEKYLLKTSKPKIKHLIKSSNETLLKISLDPDQTNFSDIDFMIENNIQPSIGHTNCTYETAIKMFDNKVKSVCHLWNAMSGFDSRRPGLLQATFMHKNVYAEMILDLIHICEQSVKFTIDNLGIDYIIGVSDAIKPAYSQDGENVSGGFKVVKKGSLITIKDTETIAGSAISLLNAFENMIKIGYSMHDAVKVTSYNAAKFLKRNDIGVIKVGAKADIVLFNKTNFEIFSTYVEGVEIKRGI